jgi:hypothetical protein
VTNGTFDTDLTGWTVFGDCSVSGGQVVIADVGGTDGAISQQLSGIVTGDVVILTFDQSAGINLIVQVGFSAGSNFDGQLSGYGAGSHEIIFVAKRDEPWVTFRSFFTDTSNTIDNISVKEIDPLSVSIQMDGRMTYADEGVGSQHYFTRWYKDGNNQIFARFSTDGANTGEVNFWQINSAISDFVDSSGTAYSPGILVPYNIASRHGSTFINGAVDGTALTANTTPTALPDMSTTDLNLAYDYNGTIKLFRVWANDLGDDGIATASTPEAPDIPANAITQRDGSYILDRSGSYIETRA